MTDLLPTAQHARIYDDVQSGYRQSPSPGRPGPRWVTIAGLVLMVLVIGVPVAYFALHRPSVYEGPVRWGPDYSSITLADRGITVSIDDGTRIVVGGQELFGSELQSASSLKAVSRAKVTYWPSADSRSGGRSLAYARTVVIE